jgi:glycosyltransferase involved in cell wall biosynthesis
MYKIAIITINYNDAKGLEKTILSVINQTEIDFEFIVIDGNSNDGSKEIIEKYKSNLTYWVSEKDAGIYNAMNKGIRKVNADYLLFMNSGDRFIEDKNILKKCCEKLCEDIVAFDCFLEKEGQIVGRRTHIENPTLFYVYKNGFKHQSTFVKKRLFDVIGLYNENYKIASDYEFWIRCFLQPTTTSKSHTLPIAIFELGGISQNSNWGLEHRSIEQEWLPNLMADFNLFEKLLVYQNSRVLKTIIKIQKLFKK